MGFSLSNIEGLKWVVGIDPPEADEDALWRCAAAWRSAAMTLRQLPNDIGEVGSDIASALVGDVRAAFDDAWRPFADGAVIQALADECDRLAVACDHAAAEVEYAKLAFFAALVLLAITLASLVAAYFAGGALGIPLAIAGAQFTIRLVLIRLAVSMAIGVGFNVGLDAMIQAYQLNAGHRTEWDLDRTVAAAEDGAIYGGVAGGVFLGGARFAPALMGTFPGVVGALGVTGVVGAVGAAASHGEWPTGNEFIMALFSGIAGGLGPDLTHRPHGMDPLGTVHGPAASHSLLPNPDTAALLAELSDRPGAGLPDLFAPNRSGTDPGTPSPDPVPAPGSRPDPAGHPGPAGHPELAGRPAVSRPDVVSHPDPVARPELAARPDLVPPDSGLPGPLDTIPPGSVPPGSVPPGSVPPGSVPPGAPPPSSLPPGSGPPGPVAPGGVPPAAGSGGPPAAGPGPYGAGPPGPPAPSPVNPGAGGPVSPQPPSGPAAGALPPAAALSPASLSATPGPLASAAETGPPSPIAMIALFPPDHSTLDIRTAPDGAVPVPGRAVPVSDDRALTLVRATVFETDAGYAFYALGDDTRDFAHAVNATPGYVTLDVHGKPTGFLIEDGLLSPRQFAAALRDLESAGQFELPAGYGLRLIVCDAAAGGESSPAAALAKALGVEVVAPDQPVWTSLDGDEIVASPTIIDGFIGPVDPPDGHWHRFDPTGKEVDLLDVAQDAAKPDP